jgi:hypothetical protein
LPEAPEYRPSPVRIASSALKRIQAISSATNAGSVSCAVSPATTYSSTCSIWRGSVSSRSCTPSPLPASSSNRISSAESELPS